MRLPFPALLAATILATLGACTAQPQASGDRSPTPATPETADTDATTPAAATRLQAYVWHLREASTADGAPISALLDTPGRMLALRFEDGRIAVLNGCNHMGGQVRIAGNRITVDDLASTLMACEPALMAVDRTAGELLQGASDMALGEGNAPSLRLTTGDGAVLLFEGEPTDETRYGDAGTTVFLEVAARTEPCHHPLIPNKQCLQVREVQYDDAGLRTGQPGAFSDFHDTIQGFEHEPGTRHVLRVKRYDIAQPPADGARHAWVLDSVVEADRSGAD